MKLLNQSELNNVVGGNSVIAATIALPIIVPSVFETIGYCTGLAVASSLECSTAGTLALSAIGKSVAGPVTVLLGVSSLMMENTISSLINGNT